MKSAIKRTRDEGNILIMSVILVGILLATGLGYMKWAVDERWDSAVEQATVQAYFLAQAGVIERGMEFLRTREPNDLPQGTVFLPPKLVDRYGSYRDTKITRVTSLGEGNVFQRSDTYDIYSTGRVSFVNHQDIRRGVTSRKNVDRTATLRARLRSFANYMYLTHFEVTQFNEVIWFFHKDSLWGRVHSNDYIGLKYTPHFYGPVSTSQDRFLEYDANPYFKYEPTFNVPPVNFPTTANSIRNNASPTISSQNRRFITRIKMFGGAGIEFHQYPAGHAYRDSLILTIGPPNWQAIFVDGECEVEGELTGKLTIGSAGDMWLVDNIYYTGADSNNGRFGTTPEEMRAMNNMLGLVSESNIIIQNNWRNGRENGMGEGANRTDRHSIVIDAGMVALGESFTFQHQNDDFELYQGPSPDERGIIHLTGAVTQWRRGYVHRSNHGTGGGNGTGYGKDYLYDFRFDERPPPYYLEAVDENGHGLFDIISWGELEPHQNR